MLVQKTDMHVQPINPQYEWEICTALLAEHECVQQCVQHMCRSTCEEEVYWGNNCFIEGDVL